MKRGTVPRELRDATRRLYKEKILSKDEARHLHELLDVPPEEFDDEDERA